MARIASPEIGMGPLPMDPIPHEDLLTAQHEFPGVYRIKAIGSTDGDFVARVIEAAALELSGPSDVDYSVRETSGGRHTAVTMDLTVQTPAQVRAIYARIREVEGLTLLF
jgi:uncharacterized protein